MRLKSRDAVGMRYCEGLEGIALKYADGSLEDVFCFAKQIRAIEKGVRLLERGKVCC